MAKKTRPSSLHFEPKGLIASPPAAVAAALERASEGDRIWFELHPGEDERHRLPVDGEFWPQKLARVDLVVVFQIQPGFRMRYPMVRLSLPGTERIQ